jgi:tol-pal system protein YbgF
MNLRPHLAAAVVGLLAPVAVALGGTASNKELEARANEIEARLRTVERANANLVPMQQQIEAARAELRALRGQIEEARHELETLRQQQRDLYGDLDRRLLLIEHGAAPAALPSTGTGTAPANAGAVAGGAAPVPAGVSEEEIRAADEANIYGEAFAALKAGRYPDAVSGFQLYLAKYPDGPRADNATYWLGEAHYVQRDYEPALRAFQQVLEKFPDSRKAGDAELKVGFCQYELKAFRNARATLERVVTGYPGTDAARLAQERLARMDVEQR